MGNRIIRWEIFPVVILVISLAVCVIVIFPLSKVTWKEGNKMWEKYSQIDNQDEIPLKIADTKKKIEVLDKNINIVKNRAMHGETDAVASLYAFADTARLRASKIEIRDTLNVEGHREIPVTITGKGDYNSIGKFMEQIENMQLFTGIKKVDLKGLDNGMIEANLEFVIIK